MFVSRGYFVALCMPQLDVPMVLGELEILDTLQKYGLMLGSTYNLDCEFVVD